MQEPVEMTLDESNFEVRGSGVKRHHVLTSHSFYYIPLKETLKQFLSHPDVLKEVSTTLVSTDGPLRDMCDGENYKTDPIFSGDHPTLQIILTK